MLQTSYKEHIIKEEKTDKQQGPCPQRNPWKQCSKIPYPWTWNSEQEGQGQESTETFVRNCQEENES